MYLKLHTSLPGSNYLRDADTQHLLSMASFPHLRMHDDVIKRKHLPRYWSFVRGIDRSPVNSPYKGQWRRALMFSLSCAWTNGWVSSREAGNLRRHRTHYDDTVMCLMYDVNVCYASPPCCRIFVIITLRPEENQRNIADDIFICISWIYILIQSYCYVTRCDVSHIM